MKLPFNARGRKESSREYRYLALVARLHGERDIPHLTRLHGPVPTDHGRAWLVERVLDEDSGRPSRALVDALTDEAYAAEPDRWRAAHDEFARWSDRTAVVVRDLSPVNLFARRLADGGLRLVLVDGIGPRGTAARLLPTRRYARGRNRAYARARGIVSAETLLAACRRAREQRTGDATAVVPAPVPTVRLLDRDDR